MEGPKAKMDAVASFVLHYLEDAFGQMDQIIAASEIVRVSTQQQALLNNKLLHLAFQLPNVLFNAGVTQQLLSPDKIHISRYQQFIGIQVSGYGLLIIDLQEKKFHARLWQSVDGEYPANEKPIDIKEVLVKGNTHKQNINTDFDYTAAIHRDKAYITDQFKEFLQQEGIPVSAEDLVPGRNSLKHKELIKALGPVREVYKGLIKTNTASNIYNITTASQGKSNLPDVNSIPGGPQLMDIMAEEEPPSDKDQQPYDFFLYIRSEQLKSEYIRMDEVGVIYINPAKQ